MKNTETEKKTCYAKQNPNFLALEPKENRLTWSWKVYSSAILQLWNSFKEQL